MKYSKPEIVALAKAARGIQGQTAKIFAPSEGLPNSLFTVAAAYEADE
jgi:hypothetical protein